MLCDSILKGGKTYRIDGILMTVPAGIDLDVGRFVEYSPGSEEPWDDRCCAAWRIEIVRSKADLYLYHTVYEEQSRRVPADDSAKAIDANRVFDEFLASFGQSPKLKVD